AWPEHQHHDDGEERRRGQGASDRVQVPVQELKDPQTWPRPPSFSANSSARNWLPSTLRSTRNSRALPTTRRSPTKSATPLASNCRSSRATPTRLVSAIAAS